MSVRHKKDIGCVSHFRLPIFRKMTVWRGTVIKVYICVTRTPHACASFAAFPLTHSLTSAVGGGSQKRERENSGAALSERGKILRRKGSPPAVREMEGPFRYPPMSSSRTLCRRKVCSSLRPLAPKIYVYVCNAQRCVFLCRTDLYLSSCEKEAAAHTARETCHMKIHWHCHQADSRQTVHCAIVLYA